jgi:hypothetical protein
MSNHQPPVPTNPCGNSCTAKCEDGKCVDPCPNGCPPCHSCGADGCDPDFDSSKCEICDSKTCQIVSSCKEADCEECQNGRCKSKCDRLKCEECKDGSCVAKKEECKICKNGRLADKCNSGLCETCTDDKCESLCDPKSCEVCDNGSCKSSCDWRFCLECVDGKCERTCGGPGDLCRRCNKGICETITPDPKKCETCTPDKGVHSLCDIENGETCCDGTCCDNCSKCLGGNSSNSATCFPKAWPERCETCDPETGEISACDESKCEECVRTGTREYSCQNRCNKTVTGIDTSCYECEDGECKFKCKTEECERCTGATFNENGRATSFACKQACTGDCARCVDGNCLRTGCPACHTCNSNGWGYSCDYNCKPKCEVCNEDGRCEDPAAEACKDSDPTGCGCYGHKSEGAACFSYTPRCSNPRWTPQCINGAPASPGEVNCDTCEIEPREERPPPRPCKFDNSCSQCVAGKCEDVALVGLENCESHCPLDGAYNPVFRCCDACYDKARDHAKGGKNCSYELFSQDDIRLDPFSCTRYLYRKRVCDNIVCTHIPYGCEEGKETEVGESELVRVTDCSCEINPCCSTDPETGEDVITTPTCCEASEEYDEKCCEPSNVVDFLCCQDSEHACCSDPNSPECTCDGVIEFQSNPCCMYQDDETAYNCCENGTSQICCEGSASYDADCCAGNECCESSPNYDPKCCSKTEGFSQACCDDENCCNGGNECCASSPNYNPICCRTSDAWDPICCDDANSPCCRGDECYRYRSGNCTPVSNPCCGITCEPSSNGCARSCFEGTCIQDDPCCGDEDPACCQLSPDGSKPPCPSDPGSGCSYQCINGVCIPFSDPCCPDSEDYDPSCCPRDPSYDPCCFLDCGNDADDCSTSCEATGRFTAECVKDDPCCGFDCPKNDADPGCSMRCVIINNKPFCDYVDAVCCPSHADYDEACCEQGPCCADNFDATCCPDSDTYDKVCCDDPDDPCCSSNDNDICCPTSPSYDKACCEDPSGPCCITAQDFDASCCPDDPSYNADCCPPNGKCCVPDCGTDENGCSTSCKNNTCVKDDLCCGVPCDDVDGCTRSCVDGVCVYDDACCQKEGTCCTEDDPICCQIEKNGGCPNDGDCPQSCKNGSCKKDDPCCDNTCRQCETCIPSGTGNFYDCFNECNTSQCDQTCLNGDCVQLDPCCGIDCPTLSDGCARRCEMGVCVQEDPCCAGNAPACCRNPGDGCCQAEVQTKLAGGKWPPTDAKGCQLRCISVGNGSAEFVKEDPCCGAE